MTQPAAPIDQLTPEHLLTLYQVSTWINSTLEFESAINNAMEAIMQVTKAQRGFLMILNEEQYELEVLVARGIDGGNDCLRGLQHDDCE